MTALRTDATKGRRVQQDSVEIDSSLDHFVLFVESVLWILIFGTDLIQLAEFAWDHLSMSGAVLLTKSFFFATGF
jgi:hypothetical protein